MVSVEQLPDTRYAVAPDGLHIAYLVTGSGDTDIVACGDWLTNVESIWSSDEWAPFTERMASMGRFIAMDPRGGGASDLAPLGEPTILESAADDIRLVMDEVGSERAFVLAHAQATPLAALFAATHPERTAGVVLYSPYASILDTGDGVGFPPHMRDRIVDFLFRGIGDPESSWMRRAVPGDETHAARRSMAHLQRLGATPAVRRALCELMVDFDVHDVLRSVQAPTLVLLQSGDQIVPAELSRHVGSLVPGAQVVEFAGDGHFPLFGPVADAWMDEVEAFVTGLRPVAGADRVLASILFTDIVGSTDRAAALGDARWRALLERHDATVRSEVQRHRGHVVKSTGDGALATFDGPARAVRCAIALRAALGRLGLEVRAGLHTGEVEECDGDVAGIAVHIAARVAALAGPGEVLVSGAVPPLVTGSGIEFTPRGEHTLRGVPGVWQVFAAEA